MSISLATPRQTLRRNPVAVLGALSLGVVLTLTGCAFPSDSSPTGVGQTQLHPTGDSGKWFFEEYAEGVSSTYSTNNTVCGIEGDIIIEAGNQAIDNSFVQARSLSTGRSLWQISDANCSAESLLYDAVLVNLMQSPTLDDWALADVRSGAYLQTFTLEKVRFYATQIGRAGDIRVLQTSDAFIGLGSTGVNWTFPNASYNSVFPLADGMFGLEGPDKAAAILDGNTGNLRIILDTNTYKRVSWASDGFMANINESDPEYAFFDIDGNEIARTIGESQYRFVPATYRGVTFTLEDQLNANTVVGVDAQGNPVLWQDDHQRNYTREGRINDLPGSITAVQGISADGTLMLFEAGPGLVIIDGHGEEAFRWPIRVNDLRIMSGYIVLVSQTGTLVLLPERSTP